MGRTNIEKQIEVKLNSREIQPSETAWDRLDSMLTDAEVKKQKRSFGWLYIAASFLVLVSVGAFFINQKESFVNAIENELVTKDISKNKQKSDAISNVELSYATPIQSEEKKPLVSAEPIVQNKLQKSNRSSNSIHQKTTINPIIHNKQNQESENTEALAQNKFSKGEAKIEIAKQNNIIVDDLLASVQLNAEKKKAAIKVNANALLSQVDGELDQTFRQKVINTISKNYQEVKVALINRNQE